MSYIVLGGYVAFDDPIRSERFEKDLDNLSKKKGFWRAGCDGCGKELSIPSFWDLGDEEKVIGLIKKSGWAFSGEELFCSSCFDNQK